MKVDDPSALSSLLVPTEPRSKDGEPLQLQPL